MRRHTIILAAVLALVAAILPASASASAPATDTALVLGVVQAHRDGTATVRAAYRCSEGQHLWVSAKQSADGRKDPRLEGEGSSALSAAWLQSHPTQFTCNGRWQVGAFRIDTAEQGFGKFKRGLAWVQFCLIGENVFISENRWALVL